MNIALIVLSFVVVAQVIERYLYSQKMAEQQHDYMVAIMAKNSNEYIATKITEKAVETPPILPDEIPIEQASEEDFTKFIKTQIQ